MTSLSSGSGKNRRSRLIAPDNEMTDELSIHTSMLRGYEESKQQHLPQLESEMKFSRKLIDMTIEQFTGSKAADKMKDCLIYDLQQHNINYLTAAYFLTLKHEYDEV